MRELLQKRIQIEQKRREMHLAYDAGNSGAVLKTSQELDQELNNYEQLKMAAGIRYGEFKIHEQV